MFRHDRVVLAVALASVLATTAAAQPPVAPAPPTRQDATEQPPIVPRELPEAADDEFDPLASAIGGVAGPRAATPAMIGDFFGGGIYGATEGTGNIAIAGGDRLFQIAENNSPLPVDRVFFDYNHYNNALQTLHGDMIDFDRYLFGLEKTFWDGSASLEIRLPFGSGLSANQSFDFGAPVAGNEFGNIPLVAKFLLLENRKNAVAAGAAAVFPTARDVRLTSGDETLLWVQNNAVHLDPYVAWLWMPNDRWFTQTFLQFDFSANGNPVSTEIDGRMSRTGVLQDQSLMLVDFKFGYWLYRDQTARWLKSIVPAVELHYTTTLQNADTVPGVTNFFNRWDNLDLTAGLHFGLGEWSTLTVFAVAPLKKDGSRFGPTSSFDGEVGVQFVRRF